jgi:hypothetical protein
LLQGIGKEAATKPENERQPYEELIQQIKADKGALESLAKDRFVMPANRQAASRAERPSEERSPAASGNVPRDDGVSSKQQAFTKMFHSKMEKINKAQDADIASKDGPENTKSDPHRP